MTTWNEIITQRRQAYPQIVADYQSGIGGSDLALKYGMSRQRIYRILKNMGQPATHPRVKARSRPRSKKKRLKRHSVGRLG